MPEYRVVWEIDLNARNPKEAARQSYQIQRDPKSTATVFDVYHGQKKTRVSMKPAKAYVPPSNRNEINLYFHCGKCLSELPQGMSPRDYQRIQAGWTDRGLQVWCVRHDCNVIHIDFQSHAHPANTTAYVGKRGRP